MSSKRTITVLVVVLVAVGVYFWTRPGKLSQAEAFFHSFQYEEAVSEYRKALAPQVGLSEAEREKAHFGIARSLQKLNRHREAIEAYEEARRLYPQSREANSADGEIQRIKLHHNIQ